MKRDVGWQYVSLMMPLIAILCACPSPVFKFGAVAVTVCLIVTIPTVRATRLYASLPIAGRDLLLARALSILAAAWLPALSGAAAAALFSRPSPAVVGPFIVAALCTLAAGLGQSIRVRELAGPARALVVLWLLTLYASLYLLYRATALIPILCALAGVALLARAWFAVPKSFELAPTKPRIWDGTLHLALPDGVFSPRLVWLPVIRPVFTLGYAMGICFLFVGARKGYWIPNCFWILVVWGLAHHSTLWLRPLPIRPRAWLVAMAAPVLLPLAWGYFCGLHYPRHPQPLPAFPIQVLDLGALLAWALVVVLAIELVDWRQWSHVPVKVRHGVGAVLMLVVIVGSAYSPSDNPLHDAVLRLAQALPNSVTVAFALRCRGARRALVGHRKGITRKASSTDKPRAPRQEYFAG